MKIINLGKVRQPSSFNISKEHFLKVSRLADGKVIRGHASGSMTGKFSFG